MRRSSAKRPRIGVELRLPPELERWRSALLFATRVDGGDWRPASSLCEIVPVGRSWKGAGADLAFAACRPAPLDSPEPDPPPVGEICLRSDREDPMVTRAEEGKTYLTELAERLGVAAKAVQIYGTAVERDGVTVVPVARARWGMGGGSGSGRGERGGFGGGGGVQIEPAGYIEIKDGASCFKPIRSPRLVIGAALAAGVLLTVLLSRLRG